MLKKKSLGQHFLASPHYLAMIADAAEIKKGETVLEVGPGEGALTKELLARGARVVAVEKDSRLIPILKEKFAKEIASRKFMLYEGDALGVSPTKLKLKKYKVAANIPYYITGALLRKFLTEKIQPSLLVLLVQREVAERVARAKKESVLSLSVKAYGEPQYLKTVPRGAFSPPPAVDSAILKIRNVSRKNFNSAAHEKRFFELVKKGFSSKRKFVLNNLGKEYSTILKNVGVSETARAEDVPLEQWLDLSRS